VSRLIPSALPTKEEFAAMPPDQQQRLRAMADPDSLAMRALNVTDPPFAFNGRDVHAAELPAANGITTARALARLYAATVGEVDGTRIIGDETVADATTTQSEGPDAVLTVETRFGSGFFLDSAFSPLYGPKSFGHAGAGGSLAFADPEANIGFGYVMNQMQQALSGDPRPAALVSAVKTCLDRVK
jgi:CubicO group peptidase (beta-lactamase class C family)